MFTPAAKRRRIDAATSALSKPFKTPMKSPLKGTAAQKETTSTPTETLTTQSEATLSSTATTVQVPQPLSTKTTNTLISATTPSLETPKARIKKPITSPAAAAALNSDPDVVPLLRTQRELERQIRDLKEELETAEQARKIEAESKKKDPEGEIDGELVELMIKWRAASRQAAEELFGHVRDRINRMGGPRAWKEMQKKQEEWQNQYDEPEPANDESDDEETKLEGHEKRDLYAEYDIEEETENEKSQRPKGLGDTGELPGQEDEFTMAMMLRTLNVDLDIIGYNKQQQRWVD